MRNECFEVIFKVTETCQNGKERRIKKSVYSPKFKMDGERHMFIPLEERMRKCIKVLEEMHYYNIEYVDIKSTTLLFMDIE
jgi:hypothetical protein